MNRQSERNEYWVGIDVAKATFDAAVVGPHQYYPDTPLRDIPVQSFARCEQGVDDLLDWLGTVLENEPPLRVVMEATGRYSTELAQWIRAKRTSLEPAIVNPRYTNSFIKSMGLRNKTDRLEARALAFYGLERQPMAYQPLTPVEAQLRDLSRYRDFLVRQRTEDKNRQRESAVSPVVVKLQNKRLKLLNDDIDRVEQQMECLVTDCADLKRDIQLLRSIYGVAFINAVTIRAELGDLRRFRRARQLTAFAGLSPRHHESGSSVRGRAHLCKQGNPRIRQCLYLSAMVAIRGDNQLAQTYRQLLAQGKPRMVALGAIMRKLLVVMRAILISGKPYQPSGVVHT